MTLYSGHDCSILEGFGAKICEMLENKLQEHLAQSPDTDQKLCFKDKLVEIKKSDYEEMMDLISNLEAANFVENSVLDAENASKENLSMIIEEDDDIEMKEVSSDDEDNYCENVKPMDEDDDDENVFDDSLDLLIKKYQPEVPTKVRAKSQVQKTLTDPLRSPVSSFAKGPLKRFKSFNVAGPSYCSSPISRVSTSKSPKRAISKDDELNDIVNKYRTDLSPIIPEKRRKVSEDQLALSPVKCIETESKEDDERKYISVDDISPSDYEVILVIDIGEAKSKTNCEVQKKIAKHDVRSVVKKLHIGDFVWVASHKTDTSKKFVLPYIIERKRLDDLAQSIKSDRFHEQKFRLKQCGIENVIYLVENLKASNYGLPFETLTQAIANTLIQNKFQIKVTDDSDHTVLYLALMTQFIKGIFHVSFELNYS